MAAVAAGGAGCPAAYVTAAAVAAAASAARAVAAPACGCPAMRPSAAACARRDGPHQVFCGECLSVGVPSCGPMMVWQPVGWVAAGAAQQTGVALSSAPGLPQL